MSPKHKGEPFNRKARLRTCNELGISGFLGLSHFEDLGAASFASSLRCRALVLQRNLFGTLNVHLFPALHTIGLHNITLLVFDWE